MPKVRREGLPFALLRHLRDRVKHREIRSDQLEAFARWLDGNPEVPHGRWFKRFTGMTVCGEGELIKTLALHGFVWVPEGATACCGSGA